jgi:hypothetical protein
MEKMKIKETIIKETNRLISTFTILFLISLAVVFISIVETSL